MIRVSIAGVNGRMGRRILALALESKDIEVVGGFETTGHPALGTDLGVLNGGSLLGVCVTDSLAASIERADVVIDFTVPEATLANVALVERYKKKIVIGTTGLEKGAKAIIAHASENVPIVCAPNMSIGVNLLFKLSRMVAEVLGEEYDVEIVEAHHKFKKDAPSGTAVELVRQIAEARKKNIDSDIIYGRSGITGERKTGTIGVHAVRGGDVVGDHTVSYMTGGERLELTHKASSRDAFAKGSLVAARFLTSKSSGLFSMQDVLGLK